jgi:hypothetical protein
MTFVTIHCHFLYILFHIKNLYYLWKTKNQKRWLNIDKTSTILQKCDMILISLNAILNFIQILLIYILHFWNFLLFKSWIKVHWEDFLAWGKSQAWIYSFANQHIAFQDVYLIAAGQWKSSLKFGHFLKKWQGYIPETKFCNFKIFFLKEKNKF